MGVCPPKNYPTLDRPGLSFPPGPAYATRSVSSHAVRSAAVFGAGTMGAQIAAHLANAGLPVLLLDVTAEAAAKGLDRLRTLKPDPASSRTSPG